MIHVDIISDSRYKFDRDRVRDVAVKTLEELGVRREAEVCVVVAGERKMAGMNKKYLGEEGATDVLSWPLEGGEYPDNVLRLGDVMVCYPVAVRQAREQNLRVDEEIEFLVGHGIRHLMGIHHE